MSFQTPILVTPENYDETKFEPGTPEPATSADGKIDYHKMSLDYKDEEGTNMRMAVDIAPGLTFGLSPDYGNATEKTPENIKGYSMCVYLEDTDKSGKRAPTQEQLACLELLGKIETKIKNALMEYSVALPDPKKAKDEASVNEYLRPVAQFPKGEVQRTLKTKDGIKTITVKDFDESKPKRLYMKVLYSKKKDFFISKLYDANDNPIDLKTCVGVRGILQPAVLFEYVYITSKGASIQVKLFDGSFAKDSGSQHQRLSRPGRLPKPEQVSNNSDPNDELNNDTPEQSPQKPLTKRTLPAKAPLKKAPLKKAPPKRAPKQADPDYTDDE